MSGPQSLLISTCGRFAEDSILWDWRGSPKRTILMHSLGLKPASGGVLAQDWLSGPIASAAFPPDSLTCRANATHRPGMGNSAEFRRDAAESRIFRSGRRLEAQKQEPNGLPAPPWEMHTPTGPYQPAGGDTTWLAIAERRALGLELSGAVVADDAVAGGAALRRSPAQCRREASHEVAVCSSAMFAAQ